MKVLKSALVLVGIFAMIGSVGGSKGEELLQKAKDTAQVAGEAIVKRISLAGEIDTLDRTKVGYGQGVIKDDKNRPVGATDFNARYGNFDAFALKENEEKTIYLTFDQGYENGYTEKILDTLKEKNVKATFFVVGDYVKRNEELVRRMIDEGHTIGNHSMSHYSMPTLSLAQCQDEITSLHDYVRDKFQYEMTLFRPPMGEFSEWSLGVTKECGYETMLWSFAYYDWVTDDQPEPSQALDKLVSAAHDGAVYLLHSVSSTNAQILGDFIDEMREKGYKFG